MITILVFPLAVGQPAMFCGKFTREQDAADFEAFFRNLGCCHLRRSKS
jgi:hypothetical protein